MDIHENQRDKQLVRLKEVIDENISDNNLKTTFNEVYDTLSLLSHGVDDPHKRLDTRKTEITELAQEVRQLTKVVAYTNKTTLETNQKTKRNSKIGLIATLVSCFLTLFMIFGGVEALQRLGFIVTVVKTLDVVV